MRNPRWQCSIQSQSPHGRGLFLRKFCLQGANSEYIQKGKPKYEPQTYDEAIALIKGWKRYPETGLARWESPSGDRVVFDFGKCSASWEKHKWPELWKEMTTENCPGHLYLQRDMWVLYFFSRCEESTPGRVVCQAYLVYKGHADWAKRLSKND